MRNAGRDVDGLVELRGGQRGGSVEELPRQPQVVLEHAVGQVHLNSPFGARGHYCFTISGNIDLDLRQATLERGAVKIVALGLFAALDVYVPEGVEVDLHGLALGGHKRARGNDPPPRAGTPLLRVTAISVFAGIDVWRVPVAWARKTWREVIRGILAGKDRELEP